MSSLNKVMFIGNLGRDAELKYTAGGDAVANFSIACTEKWNAKDGSKQERTEWVRCTLWGKRAEALAEYLQKGNQIYVEGKLQTRKWEDKDGNTKYSTEVRVEEVVLLGGRPSWGGAHEQQERPARGRASAPRQEQGPQGPRDVTDEDGDYVADDSDVPF